MGWERCSWLRCVEWRLFLAVHNRGVHGDEKAVVDEIDEKNVLGVKFFVSKRIISQIYKNRLTRRACHPILIRGEGWVVTQGRIEQGGDAIRNRS